MAMTPRQFYKNKPKADVQAVAKRAGTSFGNFQQIALAGGSVGRSLAERLCRASGGEMTELEILYPERYEEQGKSAA
jgi:Mg-chelatase subunit ChlD